MMKIGIWPSHMIAAGAVAVLAAMALAPASAAAGAQPAPASAVAYHEAQSSGIGVQHVGSTYFTGFGCGYYGRSGPDSSGRHFAVTAIRYGSGCPAPMVRAYVCGKGSCFTTNWRSNPAEYIAPRGYRIVTSYHKCSACVLTHPINH